MLSIKSFLTAIDHIDYHPSQQNMTRIKRSEIYSQYRHYHTQSRILTPLKENFLYEFLKALYKINPPIHQSLTHMKRVGILTLILGWGVYTSVRSILKN